MIANLYSFLLFKKQDLIKGLLVILFAFVVTACQNSTVPLEFAPDGQIVQQAI